MATLVLAAGLVWVTVAPALAQGCWVSVRPEGASLRITAKVDPAIWPRGAYDLHVTVSDNGNLSVSQQSGRFDIEEMEHDTPDGFDLSHVLASSGGTVSATLRVSDGNRASDCPVDSEL